MERKKKPLVLRKVLPEVAFWAIWSGEETFFPKKNIASKCKNYFEVLYQKRNKIIIKKILSGAQEKQGEGDYEKRQQSQQNPVRDPVSCFLFPVSVSGQYVLPNKATSGFRFDKTLSFFSLGKFFAGFKFLFSSSGFF